MQFTLLIALFMIAITAATPLYQTALVNVEVDLKTEDNVELYGQQTTNLISHPEPAPEKPLTLKSTGDTLSDDFYLQAHRRTVPEHGSWFLSFIDDEIDTVGTISNSRTIFKLNAGVITIYSTSGNQKNRTIGYHSDTTAPRKIAVVSPLSPLQFKFEYRRAEWPESQISLVATDPQGFFRVEELSPRNVTFVSRLGKRLT